jgi:hypothetical protein
MITSEKRKIQMSAVEPYCNIILDAGMLGLLVAVLAAER